MDFMVAFLSSFYVLTTAKQKNRGACFLLSWQPGYLIPLRPLAFRPRLTTNLTLSGMQQKVVKKDF
jgi:hypothetical protein